MRCRWLKRNDPMTLSLAVAFFALVVVAIIMSAMKPACLQVPSPLPDPQRGEFLPLHHPLIRRQADPRSCPTSGRSWRGAPFEIGNAITKRRTEAGPVGPVAASPRPPTTERDSAIPSRGSNCTSRDPRRVAAPSPVAPLPPSNPGVQISVCVPFANKKTRRRIQRTAGLKSGVPTGIRNFNSQKS